MLWTANLEIGIPKIDEQHKELIRQTEILLDRTNADRIPETLNFLADYVVRHFIDEQGLQVAVNYPKAEAHKKLHTAFVAKFKEVKTKFDEAGAEVKPDMVLEINKLAIGWLKDHILVHDKEFGNYYNAARRKGRPAAGQPAPKPAPPKYWSAELETGIPKLDAQHRKIARQLEILMDPGQSDSHTETLDILDDYLTKHCGSKEKAMAAVNYPQAARHGKVHKDFLNRFTGLKKKLATAKDDGKHKALAEIRQALVAWLKDHIMHHDHHFAAYYKKAKQTGGPAGSGRTSPGLLRRLLFFWKQGG
jgi:hemerythrin